MILLQRLPLEVEVKRLPTAKSFYLINLKQKSD